MNRFNVIEEAVKNGRKTETNYVIVDSLGHFERRPRFTDKYRAVFLCDQMNERAELAASTN